MAFQQRLCSRTYATCRVTHLSLAFVQPWESWSPRVVSISCVSDCAACAAACVQDPVLARRGGLPHSAGQRRREAAQGRRAGPEHRRQDGAAPSFHLDADADCRSVSHRHHILNFEGVLWRNCRRRFIPPQFFPWRVNELLLLPNNADRRHADQMAPAFCHRCSTIGSAARSRSSRCRRSTASSRPRRRAPQRRQRQPTPRKQTNRCFLALI